MLISHDQEKFIDFATLLFDEDEAVAMDVLSAAVLHLGALIFQQRVLGPMSNVSITLGVVDQISLELVDRDFSSIAWNMDKHLSQPLLFFTI